MWTHTINKAHKKEKKGNESVVPIYCLKVDIHSVCNVSPTVSGI